MATEPPPPPPTDVPVPEEPVRVVHVHRRARTTGKWAGITVGTLLLLVLLFVVWLNSDFGWRFVVKQINGREMASGLKINVGRIDGSLWGRLPVHALTLADQKGRFSPPARRRWTGGRSPTSATMSTSAASAC